MPYACAGSASLLTVCLRSLCSFWGGGQKRGAPATEHQGRAAHHSCDAFRSWQPARHVRHAMLFDLVIV